jgi:hypothetical protein
MISHFKGLTAMMVVAAGAALSVSCLVTISGSGSGGGSGSGTGLWEWTGGESTTSYGEGTMVAEDGSTKGKTLEFEVTIETGNATIDEAGLKDSIWASHEWSSDASQTKGMDKTAVEYDQGTEIPPVSAEYDAAAKVIRARFVISLAFGWNKVTPTAELQVTDAKGNTSKRDVTNESEYFFGDFGAPIPMIVNLEWQSGKASDLDLIVYEVAEGRSGEWIYWSNMGYDQTGCLSSSNPSDCYQKEGYVTGVGGTRTQGFSFGSLDKDDVVSGGPEIYSLDPPGSETLPGEYMDGDRFQVYVNYYQDNPGQAGQKLGEEGQPAHALISVYLNGSEKPEACLQMGPVEMDQPDDPFDGNAALEAGKLLYAGELTYTETDGFQWTNGDFDPASENRGRCAMGNSGGM